jgi:hypothetical protein
MCDVYISVQTISDYQDYPASRLRLKVENERRFNTLDFSLEERPLSTVRYFLGRYDLADRFLDVTIDDVNERYWTIVNHFEVVPIHGRYNSVVLEIPRNIKGKSMFLDFTHDIPQYTRIGYSYRFGSMEKSGRFSWSGWNKIENTENIAASPFNIGPIALNARKYFQWRADCYGWKMIKPRIMDVVIRIKE